MENAVGLGLVDSNSESDISDSWAVLDDSSLEWNNEISLGLKSHQYDFVKSTMPRSNSSKSELSDEDSIEVVAEDYTDDLADEGAEVVQDEECTGTRKLESTEKICTGTCMPIPDLPHYTTQLKKINHKWRESNPILIAILMMGIFGGLCLGYVWGSHSYKSENSTSNSTQATRALLTELENEIQFLRRQLRSTQSSLKFAVSNPIGLPKLNPIAKQDLHRPINTKRTPFKVVDPGMCSITDFIGKSLVLQDNFSKEYCLASDRPQGWTSGANNMTGNIVHTSNSSNISPVKMHLRVKKVNSNTPNESNDAKQIGQTSQKSSKNAYFEPFSSIQHANAIEAEPNSDNIDIGSKTSATTAGNKPIISNSEGISDPRPYTKLRTTVERIYTILSFRTIDHEHQPVLPSQLELLSILPQNIFPLDLSKVHFTASVYDKITSLSIQMHDITDQLFSDIDLSISNFVQHIASKIKKIETLNKKQICNLKTILESSADIALLDLDHEPIFKTCIQDVPKNEYKHEVKNILTESKDICMVSDNSISDQKGSSDKIWKVKGSHELGHRNENVEQANTQDLNFEFREAKEGERRHGKRGLQKRGLNKKSPKGKKFVLENKSQPQESVGTPVQPEADSYSNKEVKSKTPVANVAKHYKSGAKHSKLHVSKKDEKSGMKKKLNNKENKYYNESHGKAQKDSDKSREWIVNTNKTSSNVSGEWAIQMAHGRAEQRRRDHQSDWVFERAKSRMSNRRKSMKESYWHNHRDRSTSKYFSSGVCNKTMPLKGQTSKRWKEVKQHMKKNLWRPLIDSAKSVKKAFNKFNSKLRYHSHQE